MTNISIRPAAPADVLVLFGLIKALAEYEKLAHAVVGTPEQLQAHLFGDRPYAEAILAHFSGQTAGFALFFPNYSTFLTKPGIYIEDIFVLPAHRRQGIGKAMLKYIAQLGIQRDVGRLEWSVLNWNQPAISFYEHLGADVLPDWRTCRVTDHALRQLAQ